ncbi:STAS domain-containing protein [Sneathiella sp. P13V-1]|uniref:STAS domain-containing protein n=1 Tax=Sneathiella sp. P13V-1 TaxID=2697366 RepID=UPI00187BBA39|nr:STAS domain-containing protein [Sneathiella sp. P13V-1]MBE7637718.1 STAS domain-containing protein [Sneathiella sp. P13V-1]
MKSTTSTTNGGLTIALSERLTFEDHDAFREILNSIKSTDQNQCALDLSQLKAVDSAGLGMLMIAFETAEKNNIKFALVSPNGQVKRLLEISEFDKVMTIRN